MNYFDNVFVRTEFVNAGLDHKKTPNAAATKLTITTAVKAIIIFILNFICVYPRSSVVNLHANALGSEAGVPARRS